MKCSLCHNCIWTKPIKAELVIIESKTKLCICTPYMLNPTLLPFNEIHHISRIVISWEVTSDFVQLRNHNVCHHIKHSPFRSNSGNLAWTNVSCKLLPHLKPTTGMLSKPHLCSSLGVSRMCIVCNTPFNVHNARLHDVKNYFGILCFFSHSIQQVTVLEFSGF